jgi:hypothetical protein
MALFEGLNMWERATLILEIIGGIVLLIFLIRWTFTGKKVKMGLGKVSLDVASEGEKSGPQVNVEIVIEIVSRTVDVASKISHIKTKQILSDQMYYLEERLVILQSNLLAVYRSALQSALLKDASQAPIAVTSTQEYNFFTSLVSLMVEDLKRNCRGTFIRNNFHRFTDKEFDEYVEDKVDFLWVKAVGFLRDMYPSDKMSLPFEKVENEAFKEVKKTVKEDLTITFKKAVQIYHERHDEIKTMESALRNRLRTYGVDLDKKNLPEEGNNDD